MHDAGHAVADGGAAGRLDADELDVGQLGEAGEDAGGVRPAADAGDDDVGVAAVEQRPALLAGLVADDPVELAHHPRVRVRAHHRAEAVVGRLDGGHPVAHGLVDRVLQRAAAGAAPAAPRRRAGACGTR